MERADGVTENAALVARRWREARSKHREAPLHGEGEATYEGLQRFLTTIGRVSPERCLSWFVVSRKTSS
ncbi:MAG: hypothetical protein NVS2B16_01680 [Chloroflexota bacterium]